MYTAIDIPEPPTLRDDYANRSEAAPAAAMRIACDLKERDLKRPVPEGVSEDVALSWKYQRFIKDYLRCIASVDDNVGRLLRYLDDEGLTEEGADADLIPGACTGKAHRPTNLGYRGRRCLVSRKWSGKNLTEHRAERRDHVLKTLGATGATIELLTRDDPDGTRYRWTPLGDDYPPDRTTLVLHTIAQQRRWRHQYQQARDATEHPATVDQAA